MSELVQLFNKPFWFGSAFRRLHGTVLVPHQVCLATFWDSRKSATFPERLEKCRDATVFANRHDFLFPFAVVQNTVSSDVDGPISWYHILLYLS